MRALVTGAAGFIGSHLSECLLEDGWKVVGVDSFSDYYDTDQKRRNAALLADRGLAIEKVDLRHDALDRWVQETDVVFHLAGQPGVRASWQEFASYADHNLLATQRLLDAARNSRVSRFVFASSSSVYGNARIHPTDEDAPLQPISPYGVSKLAAEHLCDVYSRNWDLPVVTLRYFTVFGPRQRPDMAMHRLIEASLNGEGFTLYGTGSQTRDFTFVTDAVAATVAAASADLASGTAVNICGGQSTSLLDVIATIEQITDRPLRLERQPSQPGDALRTEGSTVLARRLLNWHPEVTVEEGLRRQVAWHRSPTHRSKSEVPQR